MNKISNEFPTSQLQEADAAHHLHPFSDHESLNKEKSRVIVRGDGVFLWDSDGNRFVDGMAGLWCVNVGHGRDEIADAVRDQMQQLSYYNTFFKTTHPPVVALSQKLAELSPDGFNRVFFAGSGSEANDTVLRMVRHYWATLGQPEKSIIIGRHNGYHGSTVAGSSLGGMDVMHTQGGMVEGVSHIRQPYWFNEGGDLDPNEFGLLCAKALEDEIDALGEANVAAFIAEPIQGAGGVIVPPATYWPEINRICRERNILLIADEVICGFGRTGNWWGSDTFGIRPDLMPIAKGLSSGYLPIGGVLVNDRIGDVITSGGGEFFHGYTYSGHPASCAAALKNIEILQRENLVERVRDDIGPYLQQRWGALADHPIVGEARMVGLVGALELVPQKPSRNRFPNEGTVGAISRDHSFKNGLIMRAVRDSLIISPPLVISKEEADLLIALVEKTLDDTELTIRKEGLMPS
ncbi:MAG: aspartate aminotransferase family protein [Hyphomicrobiales bacterium]